MDKKSRQSQVAPLQRVVATRVTDPAEQAELNELRNRRSNVVHLPGVLRSSEPDMPSRLMELCRQLPPTDVPSLLMQVAAGISAEQQLDLLEQAASGLPPDAARQLEQQLRAHVAKRSA